MNTSAVGTQSAGTQVLCILLVDDHDHVCQGLRSMLGSQPSRTICGEAATGLGSIDPAEQLQPDVVVIDIHLPRMEGSQVAQEIPTATLQVKVVVLTVDETREVVQAAKEVGARGIVMKSGSVRDLVTAVGAFAGHEPFYTQKASEILLQDPVHYLGALPTHPIRETQCEREVVVLVAERIGNKQVANTLSTSVSTVESHRRNILHKLGLYSTADLVRYAVRNGLIQP
jgi:DNA-binding NarL/FixJ family response regulator